MMRVRSSPGAIVRKLRGSGRLLVSRLETGAVFCDGGIAPGTPDRISSGVFVIYGGMFQSVNAPCRT